MILRVYDTIYYCFYTLWVILFRPRFYYKLESDGAQPNWTHFRYFTDDHSVTDLALVRKN